jgi:flavin-dependent dehydrogenase
VAALREPITIVGGGLAGLSLGIGLRRRGVPVTLHEVGRYPRHRVCGEFISGVSDATLEALGVAGSMADAPRHRRLSWFRHGRKLLSRELPEAAIAISRHRLDERLATRFGESGGELVEASRRTRRAAEGEVWSAGRFARKSRWIGLKCHVENLAMEDGLEMHLGAGGYVGLTPVEDGRVNVCGLFEVDRSLSGRGGELLLAYLRRGGHDELIRRIGSGRRDDASFRAVAGFEPGWQPVDDGVCVVGDACGMIPPFTGNGMSMAFESAELALEPLRDWHLGARSWPQTVEAIARASRRRFRRRMRAAMRMHSLLLGERGQIFIERLARGGMVPFGPLLSLIR